MDPLEDLGSLKRKRGNPVCPGCQKSYNNRALPLYCTEDGCDAYLGGKYTPKDKKPDAQMITSNIASVRLNQAGIPVRVFVDLEENKVFYFNGFLTLLYKSVVHLGKVSINNKTLKV